MQCLMGQLFLLRPRFDFMGLCTPLLPERPVMLASTDVEPLCFKAHTAAFCPSGSAFRLKAKNEFSGENLLTHF